MKVCVHWRRRHVTDERLAAVKDVLAAHPGDAPVTVDVTGTGKRVMLPTEFNVDASAPGLARELHFAMGTTGCALVRDESIEWP